MADSRILLGVIGRPHGVRGLVHVHSYTAEPRDLVAYGPLSDDRGAAWTLHWRGDGIAEVRNAAGVAVADRDAAARLTNTRLFIERGRLPEPEQDEFYLSDLVGLTAVSPDGAELGRVAAVHDYGAGPSLELSGPAAAIVPFTRACVPEVDVANGRLVVAMPDDVLVPGEASA